MWIKPGPHSVDYGARLEFSHHHLRGRSIGKTWWHLPDHQSEVAAYGQPLPPGYHSRIWSQSLSGSFPQDTQNAAPRHPCPQRLWESYMGAWCWWSLMAPGCLHGPLRWELNKLIPFISSLVNYSAPDDLKWYSLSPRIENGPIKQVSSRMGGPERVYIAGQESVCNSQSPILCLVSHEKKESYEEKHPAAHLRREKPKSSTMTRQLYLLLILPLLPPKKSTQGLGPDVLESCSLLMWANSFQRAIMLVFLTVTQLWWLGDQYYWPGLTQCIISHCLPVHCLRCCLVQHLVLSIPTFRLFLQDVVVCLSKLDGLACVQLQWTGTYPSAW